MFGAIIGLSSPTALPLGRPFNPGEVLASTIFTAPSFSDDVLIPLSVTLPPGDYALVFGSGLFGATGRGAMPLNNTDIPGSASYFTWNGNLNVWMDTQFRNLRFVVLGNPVETPDAAALDHFKCYKAKGDRVNVIVDLEDQFGLESGVKVREPKLFCNPVAKTHDGEVTEIGDPTAHLTGYKIKDKGEKVKRLVSVTNQFGDEQILTVKEPKRLLVPSE